MIFVKNRQKNAEKFFIFIFIIFENPLEVCEHLRYNIYVYFCAVGGMRSE